MNKGVNKPAAKKVLSIIGTVLTAILFAMALFVIINMIVCRVQKRPVSFFGTSFAIVQTNSMEPEIMTGDLIIFHACDISDVKVGDNVVFLADENFDEAIQGKSIVHKVVRTENGIETRGIHNGRDDEGFRDADELLGICTYNSAGWGKFFTFISKYGIFIIIAVVGVPFIIGQIIKIVKLSKQREIEKSASTATGSNENENTGKSVDDLNDDF